MTDSLKELPGKALESVRSLGAGAKDYAQTDDFKKLLPYLLSGGAAAVAGGVMTGRRRKKEGEGRMGHLRRILTNAALTGGLAAGGHALLNKGIGDLTQHVDGKIITGGAGDEGPGTSVAKGLAFSPYVAGISGTAALAATHGKPFVGAGVTGARGTTAALAALSEKTGKSVAELVGMGASGGGALDRANLAADRRASGIPSNQLAPKGEVRTMVGNLSRFLKDKITGSDAAKAVGDNKAVNAVRGSKAAQGLRNRGQAVAQGLRDKGRGTLNAFGKTPQDLRSGIKNVPSGIKGLLSTLGRRGAGGTFGQTWPRRAGRGALALTAAGLPALIGSVMTNSSDE